MPISLHLASLTRLADVHSSVRNRHIIRKHELKFGCWNVRTLSDTNADNRPARRTALVAAELNRYGIDIAALSETRLPDSDQLVEVGSGYTFFWKGKPANERREAGVGFAIRSKLVNKLEEHPVGINERLMSLRLSLGNGRFATILSVYAPTMTCSEESKTSFYSLLGDTVRSVPKEDKLVILGDFNARVGTNNNTWNCLGPHGVGQMNSNGQLLLEFCEESDFLITNTMFKHKGDHITTWMHPRSKQWHLLDYVLIRKRDANDITNVKSFHGAECWTDHALVRAKLSFSIRKKLRCNNKVLPKKLDATRLGNANVRSQLVESFDQIDNIESWDDFRDDMYERSANIIGFVKGSHKDWFDDNSDEIHHLLALKRSIHAITLQNNLTPSEKKSVTDNYKAVKSHTQNALRNMEDGWWNDLADEMQTAADAKDTKTFYNLLGKAYGPRKSSVTPLKSKDGSTLLGKSDDISLRWKEHFSDLLNIPSEVDMPFINSLDQKPIIDHLSSRPSLDEVKQSIKRLNIGKAPGSDGILPELFVHGGDHLHSIMHSYICKIWSEDSVPDDWVNAIMIPIFKNKGLREECGNYRGIALLVAAGKILAGIILHRLNTFVAPNVLPEAQCGFRSMRGTVDMIFTARQMQEKCREYHMDLYQVFIDLKKAFDTVNRQALWTILAKLGCPEKFVTMLQRLHDGMKAWVNVDGELTDPIDVENGVKQGDILGPTLFSIYLSMVFQEAFRGCDKGIYIKSRTDGKYLDLAKLLTSKNRSSYHLIREFLYADDCELVAHNEYDIQSLLDRFSKACTMFGLTISTSKTEVMYQPAPGKDYYEPSIFVYGERLKVVDEFTYLGSTLNRFCNLDNEIVNRIQKATAAFRALEDRVWKKHSIKLCTKIKVYVACILSALLYACETWAPSMNNIKSLERFHQRSLRRILNIDWTMCVPDTDILEKVDLHSVQSMIHSHRLRWVGKLVRMQSSRTPKQVFYGGLVKGKRPAHGPKYRYREAVGESLKACNIEKKSWESLARNETEWKKNVCSGVVHAEGQRMKHHKMKRAVRKGDLTDIPIVHFKCEICSMVCLRKSGLQSHMRTHQARPHVVYDIGDDALTCNICHKTCLTTRGLKRHMKIHDSTPVNEHPQNAAGKVKPNNWVCKQCGRSCASLTGLKSHLRAHAYKT